MKFNALSSQLIVDESMEAYDFVIDPEDSSHIISMLSDKLYSDKILAVIREYITNALEANAAKEGVGHLMNSKTPIRITVPNPMNPVFTVRDYGLGLSKGQITNIFVKMGKSTKRDDNNNVGAFGIGAKSFRAYGDALNIVSVCDGFKAIYTAQKTPNGGNRLFVISEPEPTDEPSGVEVSLPVNQADISSFKDKLFHLIRFFPVMPILEGTDEQPKAIEKKNEGDGWYEYVKEGWGRSVHYVLMGNVPYPLDESLLWPDWNTPCRRFLDRTRLGIVVGIGDVSVAPDREKLEYTPKTKSYLIRRIDAIRQEFVDKYLDYIQNAPTYWDALVRRAEADHHLIPDKVLNSLTWKGEELVETVHFHSRIKDNSGWFAQTHFNLGIQSVRFSHGADRILGKTERDTVVIAQNSVFFLDDGVSMVNRRIHESNVRQTASHVFVIKGDKQEIKRLLCTLKADKLPSDMFRWLRDIVPSKTARNSKGSLAHIKYFKFGRNSPFFDPCSTPPDPQKIKLYVPISHGKYSGDCVGTNSNALIKERREILALVQGSPVEVYGIRKADVKKLDGTWLEFMEYSMGVLEKWVKGFVPDVAVAASETKGISYSLSVFEGISDCGGLIDQYKKVLIEVDKAKKKYHKELSVIDHIGIGKTDPLWRNGVKDLKGLEEGIDLAYPCLSDLVRYRYSIKESINRYIELENLMRGLDKATQSC